MKTSQKNVISYNQIPLRSSALIESNRSEINQSLNYINQPNDDPSDQRNQQSKRDILSSKEEISGKFNKPSQFKQMSFSRKKQENFQNITMQQTAQTKQLNNKGSDIMQTFKVQLLVKNFVKKLIDQAYLIRNLPIKKEINEYQIEERQKQRLDSNYNQLTLFLQPSSRFIKYWDYIQIILNILCYWFCLFQGSFKPQLKIQQYFLFISFIILLSFDSIIEANRAIIQSGEIVNNGKIILKKYLQEQLLQDILQMISIFVLMASVTLDQEILLDFSVVLLTYLSIKKIIKKYYHQVDTFYLDGILNNTLYDLFTLILSIICFAHAMACIWHYIGWLTLDDDKSWLKTYSLENESIMVKYNYSFYWATMTMVTVGYGDITPQNQLEMLFANILMLCSTCMFAYSMNSIGMIVKNIYDNSFKQKRQLIILNQYMQRKNIEISLQERIRSCLKSQLEKEQDQNQEELNQILSNLPTQLKKELNTDINLKIINQIQILSSQFSQQTLTQLSEVLQQLSVPRGAHLFKDQNSNDANIYYVEFGEIEIYDIKTQQFLQKIGPGESFGNMQFFIGQVRTNTLKQNQQAKATRDSLIYVLNRDEALQIINKSNKDQELFHQIKDDILFKNDFTKIDQCCKYCQSYYHTYDCCPKLNYRPNLETVIKRDCFHNKINQRKKIIRNGFKLSSLKLAKDIQETLEEYQQTLENFETQIKLIKNRTIEEENKQIKNIKRPRISAQFTRNQLLTLSQIEQFEQNTKDSLLLIQQDYEQEKIDGVKIYNHYYPYNNVKIIVANYNQGYQEIEIENKMKSYIKYTFSFKVLHYINIIKKKIKPKRIMQLINKR